MKPAKTFLLIFTLISTTIFAQNKAQIFSEAEKVWLGIDFTQTTFVDSYAFPHAPDIMKNLGPWNTFVEREAEKYDLKKFLDKKIVINLEQTLARNKEIDAGKMIKDQCESMSQETAEKIALSYDFSEHSGFALLMVADCFSKPEERGKYWFVVVDIESKTIFHIKHVEGKPGGFGLKNYWARSFHNVLRDMEKRLEKELKKSK